MAAAPVSTCGAVTEAHLAAITELNLASKNITALKTGDFDGLTRLEELRLQGNGLTTVPEDLFSGLSSLTELHLWDNPLTTVPEGLFSGLSALIGIRLDENELTTVPEGLFNGLSALQWLQLGGNELTTVPEGLFSGLSALTHLYLAGNGLTTLPEGVFSGLSALTLIYLYDNELTTLPEGVFSGLSALKTLQLNRNAVDPLLLTVSLQKVADGQLKAVAPTGAPFDIVLPLSVANGSISGGATTITIPAGGVDSEPLTVTRTSGTTFAVTVDIGTLPGLPSGHSGYTLIKSTDLPLVLTELGGDILTPVSERTPQVRDAIVAAVPGVNSAGDVTEAHLATITRLSLGGRSITALKVGDFDGLTVLIELNLNNNQLSPLPESLFDNLNALTTLALSGNQLSSLPAGLFDNLNALTTLNLGLNQLSSLPEGIFDNLNALTSLGLNDNQLSSLPVGIFDGLSSLTLLYLHGNTLDPMDPFRKLPLTVSLEKVGADQVKAVAPSGAPFDMVLPLTVANGSISGGATTITIPAGSFESAPLTVTRTPGTTAAVTVDIGTLPGLPSGHSGYALVKSADLPLEMFSSGETGTATAATDFNGDGKTDFVDFFLFADAYGGTDPRFDLDGSGTVDFVDFFKFVDAFDQPGQAKLVALAREMLGLPAGPKLQQKRPQSVQQRDRHFLVPAGTGPGATGGLLPNRAAGGGPAAGSAASRPSPRSLGRPRRRGPPPGKRRLPVPPGDRRGCIDPQDHPAALIVPCGTELTATWGDVIGNPIAAAKRWAYSQRTPSARPRTEAPALGSGPIWTQSDTGA